MSTVDEARPPEWVGHRVARWLIVIALTPVVLGAIAIGTWVLTGLLLEVTR